MSPSAKASRGAKRAAAAKAVAAAREAERRQRRLLTLAGVGVVLVAAVVIGLIVANQSDDPPASDPTEVVAGFPDSVRADDGVVMAKPGASVTVEMYIDLQCPACKEYEERVAPTLERLVADGTVRLVVHPIAILDRMSTTEYSTRAASAVASAADEGKFWTYTKVLFAEQPPEGGDGLTADRLVELGKQVGLDSPEFAESVTSEEYREWVGQLTTDAEGAGVTGTPTILVDGEQLTDGSEDALESAVEDAAGA